MSTRFFCPGPLQSGVHMDLPPGAARHVQVLRLQPGHEITLFNGAGGEFCATIETMGRSQVGVRVGAHSAVEREAQRAVHLALGVPANERMDWLVEKATELGVASLTPLSTERSVVRLSTERAQKKQQHWQAIAEAASEQCGRNRVLRVHAPQTLIVWLQGQATHIQDASRRWVLCPGARPANLLESAAANASMLLLSGPEGGLSEAEVQAALACGFAALSLGPRVLRAETAPLAAAAVLLHDATP